MKAPGGGFDVEKSRGRRRRTVVVKISIIIDIALGYSEAENGAPPGDWRVLP